MRKQTNSKSNQEEKIDSSKPQRQKGKSKSGGRDSVRANGTSIGSERTEWYSLDPNLLRDAANFPIAQRTGAPIRVGCNDSVYGIAHVPGVMAFKLYPTVGTVKDQHHPINVVAQQLYAYITHSHSRNYTYSKSDIMLYLLAMADIYSYIDFLKRVYGLARMYTQTNLYYPQTLFDVQGIDYDDVVRNMADFRFGINLMIDKVNGFACPNTMSIAYRRSFLYQGVYSDMPSVRDQLYLYVPGGFGYYNWAEQRLDVLPFQSGKWNPDKEASSTDTKFKVAELLEFGTFLINHIAECDDTGFMHGEILNAFGDNLFRVNPLDPEYMVTVTVDPQVLEQMSNVRPIVGLKVDSLKIKSEYLTEGSDEGQAILLSSPSVDYEYPSSGNYPVANAYKWYDAAEYMDAYMKPIVRFPYGEVTPERIMSATRLTAQWNLKSTQLEDSPRGLICGTEVCSEIIMAVTPKKLMNLRTAYVVFNNLISIYGEESAATAMYHLNNRQLATARAQAAASHFKWAPYTNLFEADSMQPFINEMVGTGPVNAANKLPNANYTAGAMSDYTTISSEDLDNLHMVAIMSEFSSPSITLKV